MEGISYQFVLHEHSVAIDHSLRCNISITCNINYSSLLVHQYQKHFDYHLSALKDKSTVDLTEIKEFRM